MKAILRTACGCTKMIDIPEPAPPELHIFLQDSSIQHYLYRDNQPPPDRMIREGRRVFRKDVPIHMPFTTENIMLYHEDFHP